MCQFKSFGNFKRIILSVSAAALLASAFAFIPAEASTFKMQDAKASGVLNIGASKGSAETVNDKKLKKDVVELKYTLLNKTAVGFWVKDFPPELNSDTADTVKLGVKVTEPGQVDNIAVTLELKGTQDTQSIPVDLSEGWNVFEEDIDWEIVGDLKEAVFLIEPLGEIKSVGGKLAFDLSFAMSDEASMAPKSYNIFDSGAMGVFNIGNSQGTMNRTYSNTAKREVLEFNYALPEKTVIGVWTKDYPSDLKVTRINTAKIAVNVPKSSQLSQIGVALELKGTKDTQRIPFDLKSGWNNFKEQVDWQAIGTLREAVFVVSPSESGKTVSGKLYFGLSFSKEMGAVRKVAEAVSFSILDSRGMGVFNIGSSQGTANRFYDEALKKNVVKFDYSLNKKSSVGVWTNKYPAGIRDSGVNSVNVSVRPARAAQASQVALVLEIKGTKETQRIPLDIKEGWNNKIEQLNWGSIGDLKEVVFAVSPAQEDKPASGRFFFDLSFEKKQAVVLPPQVAASRSFGLLDAGAMGVFNIGAAQGSVSRVDDADTKNKVIKFNYSTPSQTVIGLWTKNYPAGLKPEAADAINIGIKLPGADQVRQIAVKLEIKGTKSSQVIPLEIKTGWTYIREPLNWSTIGDINEVVFVLKPMGANPPVGNPTWFNRTVTSPMEEVKPVAGTVYFDINFYKLNFVQKNSAPTKFAIVLLAAFLAGLLSALLAKIFGRKHFVRISEEEGKVKPTLFSGLKNDLLFGVLTMLTLAVAYTIYAIGSINPLDNNFSTIFIYAAVAGAIIAQVLKFSQTGENLTPVEVFQNILFAGVLAASSSKLAILQAPGSWQQVLVISNITAAVAFLIYHGFNAYLLASSGRHIRFTTGALIIATPFAFGWLLLCQNGNLLSALSRFITGGILGTSPKLLETIGRIVVVFGFNEIIINAIGVATKGRFVRGVKAHLYTLAVSLGVVLAPWVADLGSNAAVGALPLFNKSLVAVLTSMISVAGLWAEIYFITGIILDAIHHFAPNSESISRHINTGMKKGMAYSGILMAILYALYILLNLPVLQKLMSALPLVAGVAAGAILFPLVKTIIETFDGSQPFIDRMRYSYRNPVLYARGTIVGFAFAYMITNNLFLQNTAARIQFGLFAGIIASIGVSIFRDAAYSALGRGRLQSWRLYFVDGLLGAFVGSAAAFYMDASQVPVVVNKFKLYASAGFAPVEYTTYPLLNKWGRIDLGFYTGGVKLFFTESLAGVINWSVAAWLFAINRVFLEAYFQKDKTPIKQFFSKSGFVDLTKHMIYVLRWGLWMSPIIFTFLRMMPEATWYNQDGAVRSVFALFNSLTMSPGDFQSWSLNIFIYVLAFDLFRILIWVDHMGLRVATLVNLSFIGMDKLDEKAARFIGPAAAQRYIPEAVKRFTTWAPLLIPFYLPRGQVWDYAWSASESMQNASKGTGIASALQALSASQTAALLGLGAVVFTALFFAARFMKYRSARGKEKVFEISNKEYRVTVKQNGEIFSQVIQKECDISRRAYENIDPSGRVLFLVDSHEKEHSPARYWPVIGNYPEEKFAPSLIERDDNALQIINTVNNIKTTLDITLPDKDSSLELWSVTVENLTDKARDIKIVPYLEWVLNRHLDDRFHTQYQRLYPEMEYSSEGNGIFTWQKNTKLMGILASDAAPEGFIISRMDFIGRAKSIWTPRVLETLDFLKPHDTDPCPTFDPVGSLLIDAKLAANEKTVINILIGCAKNRESALELTAKYLKPKHAAAAHHARPKQRHPLIGHGEILPDTPQPYSSYSADGNKLIVHTPYTPRPYDHALSNAVHSVLVTNRGLHTSCNGNSQQNRVTPDWADTVTKELPSEAIYLYDMDKNEWYSPTHHPLNDFTAKTECEFSVDGTAVFHMKHKHIQTELTVFVPTDDPTGVYLLKIKNQEKHARRFRVAPYFQIALSMAPERSGPLVCEYDKDLDAVFYENPRNIFRSGPAFASMSVVSDRVETKRGRFFGNGRGVSHPYMVEKGEPDTANTGDNANIAGFVGTVEIPAHGEVTVCVILGQCDTKSQAKEIISKYKSVETAEKCLTETRRWWLDFVGTAEIKSNQHEFDNYLNWLKYQALAERIWARRGFYQSSGAFGFRDQLQDTVNLMWVNPELARKQIILHASQQFIEGDVFHWFFMLADGRTSFASRSHASDNLLWLAWGAFEYVRCTGDETLLDEMAPYVVSKDPFMPLPKNKHGLGDFYHRSTLADTVYRHCLKSVDLVLEKRMGINGLPLMGTGDWNDGLDEIGSEGKGESVWLGFFLYYILKGMLSHIEKRDSVQDREYYEKRLKDLGESIERTWRTDRYLRAIHDDGTEIGLKDSGIWEIDALTAAWAVYAGIDFEHSVTVFETALKVLEKEDTILLGWPALRENTKPYLGRSSKYPEGVRENGMYCHGVQWLVRAARLLAEQYEAMDNKTKASEFRETAYRLWLKISPIAHVTPKKIEIYGGQPNKQSADMLTNFDPGRMIWHGYTGAAGWMLRQAFEGVVGATLINNEVVIPEDIDKPRGKLKISKVSRDLSGAR